MQVGEVPPAKPKVTFPRYNRASLGSFLVPPLRSSYRSRLGFQYSPRFSSLLKFISRTFFIDLTFPRPIPSVCLRFFFNSIAPIISPPKNFLQKKFFIPFSSSPSTLQEGGGMTPYRHSVVYPLLRLYSSRRRRKEALGTRVLRLTFYLL